MKYRQMFIFEMTIGKKTEDSVTIDKMTMHKMFVDH